MKTLLLIAIALCATSAFAAADIFIKIDGFAGKTTDPEHPGWIVPSSFSWGSGAGPVASKFQQHSATFTLVNPPAGWEAQFMHLAATGSRLGTVLVDEGLMRATLDGAIVGSAKPSIELGISHWPLVTVTLNFASITTTTKPKPHPGAAAPPIGAVTSTSNAIVGSNVVSPNAQVFIDGVPGQRFDLLGLTLTGRTAATLTLRESPRGLFENPAVENELRIASRNLSFVFHKVRIATWRRSADGTVTTGLTFASYEGPAGGLAQ